MDGRLSVFEKEVGVLGSLMGQPRACRHWECGITLGPPSVSGSVKAGGSLKRQEAYENTTF